ncbi:MAG: hypothetical protein AAFU79_34070 [Myxococcota bacterium]
MGCLQADNPQGCVLDCVQLETNMSASDGCATCFGAAADCAIALCGAECADDPTGVPCLSCRCGGNSMGVNCVGDFEICAGVPSPLCDGL